MAAPLGNTNPALLASANAVRYATQAARLSNEHHAKWKKNSKIFKTELETIQDEDITMKVPTEGQKQMKKFVKDLNNLVNDGGRTITLTPMEDILNDY